MALADRPAVPEPIPQIVAVRCWRTATITVGVAVGGWLLTAVAVPAAAQDLSDPATAQQPATPTGPAGLLATAGGAALGGVAQGLLDSTTAGVFAAVTGWFTDAARWVLTQIAGYLGGVTSPDLTAAWWVGQYNRMLALSIMVAAAMLLVALMGAAARGSWEELAQAMLVDVPVAAVAGGIGPVLVQYLIELADQLAAGLGEAVPRHVGQSLVGLTRWFLQVQSAPDGMRVPGLMVVLLALGAILAGLIILLELLLRTNAIYFLALLVPLAYAARIWPAARGLARRVVQVTGAVIAAKPVVMLALSAGGAMLGSIQGPGRDSAQEFGVATAGVTFLALAAMAPWAILALLPPVEAEASAAGRQRATIAGMPRAGLQAGYGAAYLGQLVAARRQGHHADGAAPAGGGTRPGARGSARRVANQRTVTARGQAATTGATATAAGAVGGARAAEQAGRQPAARQRRQAAAVNPDRGLNHGQGSRRATLEAQRPARSRRPPPKQPPPLPPDAWLG